MMMPQIISSVYCSCEEVSRKSGGKVRGEEVTYKEITRKSSRCDVPLVDAHGRMSN
jgi:hypothetical protein